MDYKTNALSTKAEINDNLMPDLNGLLFGLIEQEVVVFDFTAYIEANEIKDIDYKTIMRQNRHFIDQIIKTTGRSSAKCFYQNTDGHILITAELLYLFLCAVNPEMTTYFNNLLNDVFTNGVAYSNGFVYSMAASRLPSDVLTDIIKERENDTDDTEQ